MKLKFEKATDDDITFLEKNSCGAAVPIYGVAVRCSCGFPQVVILNPVVDAQTGDLNFKALANILWLTCPKVHTEISQLEQTGAMNRMQQMLAHDRIFANDMADAHAHYYFFRKEIFRLITGHDYYEEQIHFFDAGIGGVHDVKQVKCLHINYAHYLICSSNIVGRAVAGALNFRECPAGDCQCRKQ